MPDPTNLYVIPAISLSAAMPAMLGKNTVPDPTNLYVIPAISRLAVSKSSHFKVQMFLSPVFCCYLNPGGDFLVIFVYVFNCRIALT